MELFHAKSLHKCKRASNLKEFVCFKMTELTGTQDFIYLKGPNISKMIYPVVNGFGHGEVEECSMHGGGSSKPFYSV